MAVSAAADAQDLARTPRSDFLALRVSRSKKSRFDEINSRAKRHRDIDGRVLESLRKSNFSASQDLRQPAKAGSSNKWLVPDEEMIEPQVSHDQSTEMGVVPYT